MPSVLMKWREYLEKLDRYYSLFYINYNYKSKHFKSKDDYIAAQSAAAEQIKRLESEIKLSIQAEIQKYYPRGGRRGL